MKIPWKRIALSSLLLGIAALTALAFRPGRVPVETAAAARGPLRVTIEEEGETRVRHRFVISAPAAGRLERIGLDEGDPVEPGTVVARMAPLPLDPRGREQAEARLRAAEAEERESEALVGTARAALDE
ncbi:MAG TPA: efflux transporter periplasmic adaptor subunit, partial [Thermoanaerobaculia bacterium]|nr:efflux transporter periplasmic adaptor subunit [Thermoanaerobaculia bacterium]